MEIDPLIDFWQMLILVVLITMKQKSQRFKLPYVYLEDIVVKKNKKNKNIMYSKKFLGMSFLH